MGRRIVRRASVIGLLLAAGCSSGASPAPVPPGPPGQGIPLDTWANGAVFYEVFVRSFQDSDGDGKGDLRGLMARLDYLNDGDPATEADLGVDAIWLMPIFPSPSYHGYDVLDYEGVNPEYGTLADFDALVAAAHARGIKVILDLVVNHTGAGHPWFQDSVTSAAAIHRDWYVWSATDPGWKQPWDPIFGGPTWFPSPNPAVPGWYYAVFWSGMPDLNFNTAAVRAEVKRIAGLWLARGVDGFRLDAARYLVETGPASGQADTPGTHAFWKELAAHVRASKPEAVLVGEAWADARTIASYYGSTATVPGGDELPLSFDFPLADAMAAAILAGDAAPVAAALAEVQRRYPPAAADAPFLSNHDQIRLATRLGNDAGRLRTAAALLLTVPGSPFVYYGEEIGAQNGSGGGDEPKRAPMAWDATAGGGFTTGTPWYPFSPGQGTANVAVQQDDAASLLSRYRALIRARRASAALRRGEMELLTPTYGSPPVLAFVRSLGSERVLVAHNLSPAQVFAGPFPEGGGPSEKLFADPGAALSGGPGAWGATLPPGASGVWRLAR